MPDSLGDRIKLYEAAYDSFIIGRVPVVIRCDGKGFSKWTESIGAEKPFDETLSENMAKAMANTASKIEGCLFGFTQSDEITFVLRNDQSLESQPWFANRIQKICSVTSSILTASFNKFYFGEDDKNPPAYFDTRVFAVPTVQEALNVVLWRQNDAVKNSISAACYYECGKKLGMKIARKQMEGLDGNQRQEMLFKVAGVNWNDYPTKFKRGVGCYRTVAETVDGVARKKWTVDKELPIFSKEQFFLMNVLESKDESLPA